MSLQLTAEPVFIFHTEQHSLKDVLATYEQQPSFQAVLLGRFHKIEGVFNAQQLLAYCMYVGLDYIEDIDHLKGFIRFTSKNFTVIDAIPLQPIEVDEQIELLLIQSNHKITSCIRSELYWQAVVKYQQHQLRNYETIFEAMPNGVIAVDVKGNIMMMNKAAEKISNVPFERAIGQFITNVVPPKGLLEVLQTGKGQVEKYKVRKRWYISYREPLFDGKQLVGAVGVFDDISKMEALTADLETYQQLLRENELLLNTSSLGIAVMNAEDQILRQNDRFQQLYLQIMHNDYERLKYRKAFSAILQDKEQEKILELVVSSQQTLRCRLSTVPATYNESDARVIVQLEDISQHFEQLKQASHLKQQLRHYFALKPQEIIPIDQAFDTHLQQIAKVNTPVLLTGAIGSGRSTMAQQLIKYSDRHMMPFVEINCMHYTAKQLEHLFFSIYDPPIICSLAAGGTLYMRNIDYMPTYLQRRFTKILDTLNQLNVRLISSISSDDFRIAESLFYAINAVTVQIPSPQSYSMHTKRIIQKFVQLFNEKYDRQVSLSDETMQFLVTTNWPQGLHSIIHALEQCFIHVQANVWHPSHFLQPSYEIADQPITVRTIMPLKEAVDFVERELLQLLIEQNLSYRQIAKILQVNPSTIVRKIKKLEVEAIDS